jgi:hypothetical protein
MPFEGPDTQRFSEVCARQALNLHRLGSTRVNAGSGRIGAHRQRSKGEIVAA